MLFATSHRILVCLHSDRVDNWENCLQCWLIKKAAFTLPSSQMRGKCVKRPVGACSVCRFLCVYVWTEIFLNRAYVDVIFFCGQKLCLQKYLGTCGQDIELKFLSFSKMYTVTEDSAIFLPLL